MTTRLEDEGEPLHPDVEGFNDVRGWYHAFAGSNGPYEWRSWNEEPSRPRLYYAAGLQYRPREEYLAVDGMGRTQNGDQPFECTINAYTGKFERLCVQTRDSLCSLQNSTWDRTIMRRSAPRILRLALSTRYGIPKSKRWDVNKWDAGDWGSFAWRCIPAGLGAIILVRTLSCILSPDPHGCRRHSSSCQTRGSQSIRTHVHICLFDIMGTSILEWPAIYGKTEERSTNFGRVIRRGIWTTQCRHIAPSGHDTSVIWWIERRLIRMAKKR